MRIRFLAFTALSGLALLPVGARAEMNLSLGGYFSGYGVWADNNIADRREFDLRRDTEVHVSGETTLDNGLTVGFHTEQALGGATLTDEVYAYLSGSWGRVNLGSEDGAAYLLQVAAPSADSNIDGLRTYIQAIAPADPLFTQKEAFLLTGLPFFNSIDYGQVTDLARASRKINRITYMTPKLNGIQAGLTYTPAGLVFADTGTSQFDAVAPMPPDNQSSWFGNIVELALRWDARLNGIDVSWGAGYGHAARKVQETLPIIGDSADTDRPSAIGDLKNWNTGLTLGWKGFTAGAAYLRTEGQSVNGVDVGSTGNAIDRVDRIGAWKDNLSLGLGWDSGPYHLGASWLNQSISRDASGTFGADDGAIRAIDAEVNRYTIGGGYTYGPGMSLRGAVAWGGFNNRTPTTVDGNIGTQDKADDINMTGFAATNNDFVQVTLGTQINF